MDTPKKKRGRKPKIKNKEEEKEEVPKVPKKRGRRRKSETEALRKYTDKYEPEKELIFNTNEEENLETIEESDIEVVNIGGLVITKKKGKGEDIKDFQKKLMTNKLSQQKQKNVKETSVSKQKRTEFKIISTNTDNWPHSTGTYCWWCCHGFDNPPVFLPVKYDDKRKRFHVKGNFCSWGCVKAYNLNGNQTGMFNRCTLISFLAKKLHGFSDKPIKCALPRESLEIYGGKYSIQSFREYSNDDSRKIIIYNPKVLHVNDNIID